MRSDLIEAAKCVLLFLLLLVGSYWVGLNISKVIKPESKQDMFDSMLCTAFIPAGTILVTTIKCTDGNRYRRIK